MGHRGDELSELLNQGSLVLHLEVRFSGEQRQCGVVPGCEVGDVIVHLSHSGIGIAALIRSCAILK